MLSNHPVVYQELRSRLRARGYEVRAEVMHTKHHGIPQDRERGLHCGIERRGGEGMPLPGAPGLD
eukprot:814506-Lingulodinium_polyedra.AAC.1